MSTTTNASERGMVTLPNLADIHKDLSSLQAQSLSLSQVFTESTDGRSSNSTAVAPSSGEKLSSFKASIEKSQADPGVVENGFDVATEYLTLQERVKLSRQEMETFRKRVAELTKEMNEINELIDVNWGRESQVHGK